MCRMQLVMQLLPHIIKLRAVHSDMQPDPCYCILPLVSNPLVSTHMPSPPGVKLVLEAVCIMKAIKPVRVKDAQSGRMVDDYWEASKRMLMEDDFLLSLRNYDKDHIDPAIIKRIKVCCVGAGGIWSWFGSGDGWQALRL